MFHKHIFFYWIPANKMFLNDTFQHLRFAGVIPGPLGINDRYGPFFTYAQTVGFGTVDSACSVKIEFA